MGKSTISMAMFNSKLLVHQWPCSAKNKHLPPALGFSGLATDWWGGFSGMGWLKTYGMFPLFKFPNPIIRIRLVLFFFNAHMTGVFVDGIHGTPYIAAPWIRHGIWYIYVYLTFFYLQFTGWFWTRAVRRWCAYSSTMVRIILGMFGLWGWRSIMIHQQPTTFNFSAPWCFSMVFTMGSLASFLSIDFRKFDVWSPHVQ